MEKYGIREPFDVVASNGNEFLFGINTASNVTFKSDESKNYLVIDDALIDIKLFNDVLEGLYRGKHFELSGHSFVRGLDGFDKKVNLNLFDVKIKSIQFDSGEYNNIGYAKIVFVFPDQKAFTIEGLENS